MLFEVIICRYQRQGDKIKHAFINVMGLPSWRAVLKRHYDEDGPGVRSEQALPEEALSALGMEAQSCGT